MLTNMFCGKKVLLESKKPIYCTGRVIEIEGVKHQEFVQRLPSPDWLTHYYFPNKTSNIRDNIISGLSVSEVRYHPTLIEDEIKLLMRRALLKNKVTQEGLI